MSESKPTHEAKAEELSPPAKGSLRSTPAGRLAIIGIASAVAFGFGYLTGTDMYGFGQPGLLVLAMVALYSGVVLRRMLWGALAGLAIGIIGAAGMTLRLATHPAYLQYWHVAIGVLGGIGGILCTITGAISGGLVELFRRIAR